MRRFRHPFLALSLLLIIFVASLSIARAHGTAYRVIQAGTLAAVEFTYSDGEPMAYVEVLAYSPRDQKVEHQYGRADKHGRVAFYPDVSGTWLIKADDGMGHVCKATVEISAKPSGGKGDLLELGAVAEPAAQRVTILKTIAGLSVILNIALAVQVVRRRSKPRRGQS